MATLLHLDASARPGSSATQSHGSHTRRLSARFVSRWREARPDDAVRYRDVGQHPPGHVTARWIEAAFAPPERRAPWMAEVLAESDALIDELIAADIIVIGVPMYNFGLPAQLKAYVDNIVRVGRTFGFDRARQGEPYWPLLAGQDKRAVLLGSRGDHGYERGGRLAQFNHVEPALGAVLEWIGIDDIHRIAVEHDEYADERLATSLAGAEQAVDALVAQMTSSPAAQRVA